LQVLLAVDDLDVFKGVELKLRHVALPGFKIQPTHVSSLFPCKHTHGMPPLQVLLAVDDLDVFKGIELKLQAYEQLLEEHPEWIGKVVLVQVRRRGGGTPPLLP
jgi:hypothetical protein